MDDRFSVSTVLEADFNEVADDGLLAAWLLPGEVRTQLDAGDLVQTRDVEGNSCWSRVAAIRDSIFLVEPLWSTWRVAEPFRIQQRNPKLRITSPTGIAGAHPA